MAAPLIDGIVARVTGPMSFRFIMQPVLAILMGVRDGRTDAKTGTPPFLLDVFTRPGARRQNLLAALKTLLVPIAIGTVLDAIAQYLIFRDVPGRAVIIHPLAALTVGTTVIGVPYALARSVTNRLVRPKSPSGPTP